jgi:uncharacterized protein (DUF488 family)
MPDQPTIFTIGHSTNSYKKFVGLLQSFNIETLAHVRNFPGSMKFPHFNKEFMEAELGKSQIEYCHFKNLGGRRKPDPDSKNTAWRHSAFRGYADYMESTDFIEGIHQLQQKALESCTAIMCSEAVWWRCHRSMVSDYLKSKSWKVMHILNTDKVAEHPYTAPAKIVMGRLTYK